ncbi:MAG: hypothetical protein KC912_14440 [Proteobacteria bacterium]|nr:hypothetical protein [Pseudomonadota bacterium]
MNRAFPLLLLAVACSGAEDGVRVLGPERVEIQWDEAHDSVDDGMIAAIPVDLLAYAAADGSALPHEPLQLSIEGATLATPADILDHGEQWNALSGRDIEVLDSANLLEIDADDMGAVRVIVLVDRFPLIGDCYLPLELVVDAADESLTIPIAPRVLCR